MKHHPDPVSGELAPAGGRIRMIHNAVFYPHIPGDRRPFSMGVRCEDGSMLTLVRGWNTIAAPPAPTGDPQYSDCTVVFGGFYFAHFGHFLLETLAYAWAGTEHPELPIAWIGPSQRPAFRDELLELLGVRNQLLDIREPTRFKTVLVPQAGLKMFSHVEPWFARRLAVYPAQPCGGGCIWLSRSGLRAAAAGFENEREIEVLLEQAGWTIFHPEQHSLAVQLETLARARRIAGIEGSAFHSLLLLERVTASIDIFMRTTRMTPNFHAIAAVKGFAQRCHFVDMEIVSGEGRHVRSRVRAEDVLTALNE